LPLSQWFFNIFSARSPKTGEGSDAGWMTLLAVSIVCLMGCGIYGTKEKNTEQH
jgi:LPXTG-motif cell wall-anchored protein